MVFAGLLCVGWRNAGADAEGAEEIASASEEEEAAELAEDMLNDTINFDNER